MTDLENGAGQPAAEPTPVAGNEPQPDPIEVALSGMDAIYDKINPPRTDGGQFASQNSDESSADEKTEPAGAEDSDAGSQELKSDQSPAPKTEEQATPAIPVPASWSAEMKAKWESLPSEARQYIAQRESEAHKRISEMGQAEKQLEPMRGVLEHFRPVYEGKGLKPEQAVGLLLQAQAKLDADPANAIQEIANAYGVDLAQVYGGKQQQPAQAPQGEQTDYIRTLESKIANLERGLGYTYQTVEVQRQAEVQRANATLAKLVEDFAKDKTDFAEIEDDVARQARVIKEENPNLEPQAVLQKAYEQARWSNPDLRARLIAEQAKQQQEAEEQKRKTEADKAKKAGAINVRSQPNATPVKGRTWEETMDGFRSN